MKFYEIEIEVFCDFRCLFCVFQRFGVLILDGWVEQAEGLPENFTILLVSIRHALCFK